MRSENINPWLQLWIHPKKTMRSILDTDSSRAILWLAVIWGAISAFSGFGYLWMTNPDRENLSQIYLLVSIIIAGGFAGIIHLYLGGWLYKLTSSWLGGKGTFTDTKCVVGWSYYPFILGNIAGICSIAVIPNPWLQLAFWLINVVIAVWGIVIFLNALGEAHRFSAWKSLLAVIIACILIFVAIMIIALLVPLLAPLFE